MHSLRERLHIFIITYGEESQSLFKHCIFSRLWTFRLLCYILSFFFLLALSSTMNIYCVIFLKDQKQFQDWKATILSGSRRRPIHTRVPNPCHLSTRRWVMIMQWEWKQRQLGVHCYLWSAVKRLDVTQITADVVVLTVITGIDFHCFHRSLFSKPTGENASLCVAVWKPGEGRWEGTLSAGTENLVERIISQGFHIIQRSRPGRRPGRGPRQVGLGRGWGGRSGQGSGAAGHVLVRCRWHLVNCFSDAVAGFVHTSRWVWSAILETN